VLEKVREKQSSLSCEKWNVTKRREERNTLHTIKRRNANCIGHILFRNCLLKHVIERKIDERIRSDGKKRKKKQVATG
jgi:hypothetical protein